MSYREHICKCDNIERLVVLVDHAIYCGTIDESDRRVLIETRKCQNILQRWLKCIFALQRKTDTNLLCFCFRVLPCSGE